MDSSSGLSSNSSGFQNSGTDQDHLQLLLLEQRRRRRMISNRESARRSRLRKQKHLEELTALVARLRKENQQILAELNVTTQRCLTVEAENAAIRAQAAELNSRIESLNEVASFGGLLAAGAEMEPTCHEVAGDLAWDYQYYVDVGMSPVRDNK